MSNGTDKEKQTKLRDLMTVENEAHDFSMKFRNPDSSYRLKNNLTIDEVLREAGFKQIGFTDLDLALQEGIKKTRAKNWYGYPLDRETYAELPDRKIFINEKGDTIYCVAKPGNVYSWSRIEKTADSYRIDSLNHDSNIGEVIDNVIFFEIQYRQMPDLNPRYTESDIIIPISPKAVAEEARKGVEEITGLA